MRPAQHRASAGSAMATLARTLLALAPAALLRAGAQPPATVGTTPPPAVLDVAPVVEPHRIALATYDGSGQAVHPDVVYVPGGWRGWAYWMAFTPYPRGDRRYENPSLAVSEDGEHWVAVPGMPEPLVAPPAGRDAYQSDPDLHHDATADRLVLVYRQVTDRDATLFARESSDGRHWSAPRPLLRRAPGRALSPSVVATADAPNQMWVVDAGGGCTTRRSTVRRLVAARGAALPTVGSGTGAVGAAVALSQPGYVVWHLDVLYVAATREYWALYAAFPVGAHCDAADLFVARSLDGRRWTHAARPLLARGRIPWASASLYRGTLWYDASQDLVHVVVSGRGAGSVWSVGEAAYALRDWRRALADGGVPGVTAARPASRAAASARR